MSDALNNSGESLTLNKLILHKIDKTSGSKEGKVSLRRDLLNEHSGEIKEFAQAISLSYHKRTSKEFARFKESPKQIYEQLVEKYLKDGDFIDFSHQAAEHLKDEMNKKPASTGGYLVFADYSLKNRFIMAVLLNNKAGFTVNDDLFINMVRELNIEQIAMAGFINLSTYGEADEKRKYLSFMRGIKDVSDYFVSFMGADDNKSSSEEMTRLLIDTLRAYFKSKDLSSEEVAKQEESVYRYCEEKRANREPVTIREISSLLNPEEEKRDDFFEFSQEGDSPLSNTIESISKNQINKLKLYKYSGNGINVSFQRKLYEDGTIKLSQDKKKLEIEMPPEMLQSIIDELEYNG